MQLPQVNDGISVLEQAAVDSLLNGESEIRCGSEVPSISFL